MLFYYSCPSHTSSFFQLMFCYNQTQNLVSIQTVVFWVVKGDTEWPSLCCLEDSVLVLPGYQLATQCHIQEDHNLSIHCCRNLKSYTTLLPCHLRSNDTVSGRRCSHQYVYSYHHGFLSFFNNKIWLKLIHSWTPYTRGPICSMADTKVALPSPTVTKNYHDIPNQLTRT